MIAALAVSVDWLAGNAHYIAAGGLLLAILLVAGANAYRHPDQRPTMMRALESPRQYYYTWVAIAQARMMMANHDEVRSGEIAAA
jgi:hypothetical protein